MPGSYFVENPYVQAEFKDGRTIKIPRMPLKHIGFEIPGTMIRPDGEEIYVSEIPVDNS